MSRSVNLITVFLASPGDVQPEREIVSLCIQQWNQIYGFQSEVYFELLKWETSIAAGFGNDGQDVINENLPDYDLFIGLFWTRLGTKTPRSSSGTAEEYEKALSRFKEGDEIEIAFYFKDGAIDSRKLDLSQLQYLREFEHRIQTEGAFSKVFTDDDSLRYEINLLLDRTARRYRNKNNVILSKVSPDIKISETNDDDPEDDIGLLDINDNIEKYSAASINILEHIANNLNYLTENISKSTKNISEISELRQPSPSEVRPIIDFVSGSMDKFSDVLESSIPDFSENSSLMASNIRDLIRVSYDFIGDQGYSLENAKELKNNLGFLVKSIEDSSSQMESFRNTIFSLQRMTSNFNKSKKRLVQNLDTLLDRMNSIKIIISQSLVEIDKLIDYSEDTFGIID